MKRSILAITSISLLVTASCDPVPGGGGAAETCILSPEATEILPASKEDGSLCGADLQPLDSPTRPWSIQFGDPEADGAFLSLNEDFLDGDISVRGWVHIAPRGTRPITFRGSTAKDSLIVDGDTISYDVEFENESDPGRVAVRFEARVTGCESQLLTGPRIENVFQLTATGSIRIDDREFSITAGELNQTSKRAPGPCSDALRPLTDQLWTLRTASDFEDAPESDLSLSFGGRDGRAHFANVSVPGVDLGCDDECPATSIRFDGDTMTFEAAYSETASVSFVGRVTECRDDLYLTYVQNGSELVVDGEGAIEIDGVEFPLTRLHFGKTEPVPPLRDLCAGDLPSSSCILHWAIRTTDPRVTSRSGRDPVLRALGQRQNVTLLEIIDPGSGDDPPAGCEAGDGAAQVTFDGERLLMTASVRTEIGSGIPGGEIPIRRCTASFDGVVVECVTVNDSEFFLLTDVVMVRLEGIGQTVVDGVVTPMNQLYMTGIPTDAPPPGPTGTIEDFFNEFPFLFP